MRSYIRLIFSVFIVLSSFLLASDGDLKVYKNFTLSDYNGKEYLLYNFKESKAIVIMFIATQCPVSNAYNKRMAKLYADYKDKGVTFLGINSNKQEDIGEIKEHAEENGLDFIILKDVQNKIADVFEASFTPEIYVLNPDFKLLYHGRIDDSRKESKVETMDLRNALNEILAGKEVTVNETKAFGCTIKRIK
jgi:peroxiredoxin